MQQQRSLFYIVCESEWSRLAGSLLLLLLLLLLACSFACLYFTIFGIIIRSLETICGLCLNNNVGTQSEEHKYFWCFMHKYVRIYNYNYCDHGDSRHDNMLDSQTTPLHFLTKEFVSEALWEFHGSTSKLQDSLGNSKCWHFLLFSNQTFIKSFT